MTQYHRRLFPLLTFVTLSAIPAGAQASDIVEVLPLTDQIVLVHFDDGHVIHHKRGEPRSGGEVVVDPLDVDAAARAAAYGITSTDDAKFGGAGKQPTSVARKSKGTDFAWFVDKWENNRAVNARPDHAKEHWLYITLPEPMKSGSTYTINTGDLAKNGREWKLKFDEKTARSDAIHVNLLGYVPGAPQKFGYVYQWMGDGGGLNLKKYEGRAFHVIDQASGKAALTGKLTFRKSADNPETFHKSDSKPDGNYLKADVYECDFSRLKQPGTYMLSVEGIGCSFPFEIDPDVYREAFQTVGRALYHNRSGIELKEPYTEFTRPAPHNPSMTPGFKGKLIYTTVRSNEWGSEGGDAEKLLAGSKGPLDAWGWYQDAGDWDSYISHLRVPQELLTVYELAPRNFSDGEFNIPESGNGIADILDEAAWLPRFCYRLRHELMDKKYGTGGIGLRIAGDAFGGDEKKLPDGRNVGQGSWEDVDRTWAASGEDPWSTYRYAGTAAHLAYCLDLTNAKDPEAVDWAKEAADSYTWAKANTRPGDEDDQLRQHRSYAAAALFRITGDMQYEQQFNADTQKIGPSTELWNDERFGPIVYALSAGKAKQDTKTLARIKASLMKTANSATDSAEKRALRWGGNWHMPMLIGQQTTPWMLETAVAYALAERDNEQEQAQRYLAALYTTCDYFLGANSSNTTWVTGLGPRHPVHVFHMDAWYNGKDRIHPGLIPYSPWRKEKDFGAGPWDNAWAYKTVHPSIDAWPGNEQYFDNRCAPLAGEFTVHQNIAPATAIYGLLCAPEPAASQKPSRK